MIKKTNKQTNSKKDFKKNTKLEPSKSLKLMNRVMRMGLPYKRQARKNYKAKLSIIKNKK
jgi:hypothetical protein